MRQQSFFEKEVAAPLASRLRPQDFSEFVGQDHLLGENGVLRRLIDMDQVSSMIFWGPPGVGKTTLARIIAHKTQSKFIDFSAVTSGIKEIKEVMNQAETSRLLGERTILFVDEIHRFNKAQQDAFLPFVEKGRLMAGGLPHPVLLSTFMGMDEITIGGQVVEFKHVFYSWVCMAILFANSSNCSAFAWVLTA